MKILIAILLAKASLSLMNTAIKLMGEPEHELQGTPIPVKVETNRRS